MSRPVAYYPAQLPMSVIHQKKPDPLDFHHVEGYQDPTTWARVKGGVKMLLNCWTPCIFKYHCLQWFNERLPPSSGNTLCVRANNIRSIGRLCPRDPDDTTLPDHDISKAAK